MMIIDLSDAIAIQEYQFNRKITWLAIILSVTSIVISIIALY